MQKRKNSVTRRLLSGFLTMVLALGVLPMAAPDTSAASWMDPYLNKAVEWGVMRGDIGGNLNANRDITRAEFVTMVNRAFGYTQTGENPFQDVKTRHWYYDDITIAYKAGYFAGTSASIADAEKPLTREQATMILGRNMMLREKAGEALGFTDSRTLSDWSRNMVYAAKEMDLISGYADGSFRPLASISRGEVACLLVNAIGTPLQKAGEYSLGGVYGNVTITAAGVTLRNTTIAGDLYLTGGIGLGDVTLENVTVLGKIVVSGAGGSEKGENAVLLRNVTAKEMIVDSLSKQFVSIKADGETEIARTSVRANAYLQDNTNREFGLKEIEFDAKAGDTLNLAGNIASVRNITPNSSLVIAQGTAQEVTMDERAVGASLSVLAGAWAKQVNLDEGAAVYGTGDIKNLAVAAAGVVSAILPDSVSVRPGLTASIAGETMDYAAAAEASESPRLLAGYPAARNVAPTTAEGVFSGNKKGKIYWAVSAVADGSIDEEDLIAPPSYTGKIIKNGTLDAKTSKTELTAKISALNSDGSYYLSAVLVDDRGQRSPVKVNAFTTPDDTVPNFASGYPYLSKITNTSAQVAVMPTKSAQLYYALLPKGSVAPKPAEFKANAVTGNLGYGSMEVTKNTASLFTVNNRPLQELETYDLYLWLNDFNSAKSSPVKKLNFTTKDMTPPVIMHMDMTGSKATSVEMTYALNEPGTLYWAVVKEGEDYPKPLNGQSGKPALSDDAAKIQVQSGMNALKSGNSRAAKENTDVKFTISGLQGETAYDLYYVAVDLAGNYSNVVAKTTINTLDDVPPKVTQEFTRYNGNDKNVPLPNTDIRLVFSESIQGIELVQGQRVYTLLMPLYEKIIRASPSAQPALKEDLAAQLRKHIQLYQLSTSGQPTLVKERTSTSATNDPWTIDYREVGISMEDGKMILTFPYGEAIKLASGASYYFTISGIADTSTAANAMGNTTMDRFTTVFAQVSLSQGTTGGTVAGTAVDFDMAFKVTPISTSNVDDGVMWDILLWSAQDIKFSLYTRQMSAGAWSAWTQAANSGRILPTAQDLKPGVSVMQSVLSVPFEKLNTLDAQREYAIVIDELVGSGTRGTWSGSVEVFVDVVAGDRTHLQNLANNVTAGNLQSQKDNGVVEIGLPKAYKMQRVFQDKTPPEFTGGYPKFVAGDSGVNLEVQIDRDNAYYYYVVAPVEKIPTEYNGAQITLANWTNLPQDGLSLASTPAFVNPPTSTNIMNPSYRNVQIRTGNGRYRGGTDEIPIDGLSASTKYIAYIVLKGEAQDTYSQVYAFRFETTQVQRPILTVQLENPVAKVKSDRNTDISYMLVVVGKENSLLREKMSAGHFDPTVSSADQSNYGGYTLLQAMNTPILSNDGITTLGSAFDMYADQNTKNSVASLIRTQGGTDQNVALVGSASLGAGRWEAVNCEKAMSGTANYWFVVVGKSPLGSGDAFCANKSLFVPDNNPPRVISVNAATTSKMFDDYAKAVSKTYTGTLVVTFDKELFYKSTDDEWTPVLDMGLTGFPTSGYTSSVALMPQMPSGVSLKHAVPAGSGSRPQCYSLTFDYVNISQNTTLTFDRNLCDYGGITGSNPLTLTMKLVQVNGIWEPSFTISPRQWDQTGK